MKQTYTYIQRAAQEAILIVDIEETLEECLVISSHQY